MEIVVGQVAGHQLAEVMEEALVGQEVKEAKAQFSASYHEFLKAEEKLAAANESLMRARTEAQRRKRGEK